MRHNVLELPGGRADPQLARIESVLTPPLREAQLVLRDGRKLAFAEFGARDPDLTVLWFHGTPGARRQIPPTAAEVSQARGLRLIGVDRPGVGDSSPHAERTLLSWARDIEELVDALELPMFGVAGISGGGPHVLAVAHALPERVKAAGLLGSMAPLWGSDAPSGLPSVLPHAMQVMHHLRGPFGNAMSSVLRSVSARAAELAFPAILRAVPPSDRSVLSDPRMRAMFVSDIFRGSRQSFRAQAQDMSAYGRDWGFSLRGIRVPTRIWHGTDDQMVPYAHAEHVASLIPRAELVRYEGEGHFAGFIRPAEVLSWFDEVLRGAAPAPVLAVG